MDVNKMQTFIMTLKHRPDRYWSALGALGELGFNMDRVFTVMGKYWRDFDGYQDILEAAAADGFPFFLEKQVKNADMHHGRLGFLCNLWSGCRIFRHIAQQSRPCLVFEDDILLRISYSILEERLSALPDETEVVILSKKEHQDIDEIRFDENWLYGSYHKRSGGGYANIYTPAGAKAALECAAIPGIQTVENIAHHLPDEKVFCASHQIIKRNECGGDSDVLQETPDKYTLRQKAWGNGVVLEK